MNSRQGPPGHLTGRPPLISGGRLVALIVVLALAVAALLWSAYSTRSESGRTDGIIVVPGTAATNGAQSPQAIGTEAGRADTPGARFGAQLGLVPSYSNDRLLGYAISADADPELLARTKLREGDLLLDIEGSALDPQRVGALAEELAQADAVEISFEREGQLRKRTIDLTR